MIRKTFESYLVCKEWLEDNKQKRESYFHSINKSLPSSVNYDEYLRIDGKQNDYRLSILSDKLDAWDKRYLRYKKHCLGVLQIYDIWLKLVHQENREIIRLAFMFMPLTHEEIAKMTGFERSTNSKIIDKEILYLTNLS